MARPLNPEFPNETARERFNRERALLESSHQVPPSDGAQAAAKFEAVPPAKKTATKKKAAKK